MNVFDLAARYRDLMWRVECGELTIDEAADSLRDMQDALQEKITNIAYVVKNKEAAIAGMQDAHEALEKRIATAIAEHARLKKLLVDLMATHDLKNIDCGYFRVRRTANPPSAVITDESAIPPEYWRDIPEEIIPASRVPDKKAIIADLKEGVIIPGVEMIRAERVDFK
jgi:hypothetical protein